MTAPSPAVHPFFDQATGTVTYVVADPATSVAAIVDPVLDFDPKAGRTSTASAQRLLAFVRDQGLHVEWILETHAHADHLSAAGHLAEATGARIGIGRRIEQVQQRFGPLFQVHADPRAFDHLFDDGETFHIGSLEVRALLVPGHTPADMAYLAGDAVFVGDTLFLPDVGTARADFPRGDARTLYRSIRRLLDLPGDTRLFVCHDYPPAGREPAWETTVAAQRASNIHVHDGVDEAAFVAMRTARDATLDMPTLILPSLQVNVAGGRLPAPDANGISYLRLPLNVLGHA
jgi:glyoxylase-like metal-dependent hydrolase (beta-lactamase superfamily II)